MSNKSQEKKTFPSVLAFAKKLVPSDGYMYGTNWETRTNQLTPLKIREKSVRGTISNRLNKSDTKDSAKLDAAMENPNLQTIDYCSLEEHQDTLKLHFTLKILGNLSTPSACNNQLFAEEYKKVVANYISEYKFTEIAKRYAINLASARFLWRNRVGVERIEVKITDLGSKETYEFNALSYPLNDFDFVDTDQHIENLATKIAKVLSSEDEFLILDIETYAKIGKSQDVYPSEELVLGKSKDKGAKSKILYSSSGVAAMHSQKIGNAIRTIDTWYSCYDQHKAAIAIEPYGTVTTIGEVFRRKKKGDFYSIFDEWLMGTYSPNEVEKHYTMAVLVRGGVFGKPD